jgi:hypothetical protein
MSPPAIQITNPNVKREPAAETEATAQVEVGKGKQETRLLHRQVGRILCSLFLGSDFRTLND